METANIVQQWWEALKRFYVYAAYCVDADMHVPVCRDFWMETVFASLALALLIVFFIGRSLLVQQLEFRRNRKRLEARKIVADEETMSRHKWAGDDAADIDFPQEELAAKIRDAMKPGQSIPGSSNEKS